MQNKWYAAKTGNHQGLVIDEKTGYTIAVAYDKKHTSLLAAAPDLLKLAKAFEQVVMESGNNLLSTATKEEKNRFISSIVFAWNDNCQALDGFENA